MYNIYYVHNNIILLYNVIFSRTCWTAIIPTAQTIACLTQASDICAEVVAGRRDRGPCSQSAALADCSACDNPCYANLPMRVHATLSHPS